MRYFLLWLSGLLPGSRNLSPAKETEGTKPICALFNGPHPCDVRDRAYKPPWLCTKIPAATLHAGSW